MTPRKITYKGHDDPAKRPLRKQINLHDASYLVVHASGKIAMFYSAQAADRVYTVSKDASLFRRVSDLEDNI